MSKLENEVRADEATVGLAPPCKHMEGMLNQAADGTAGRFSRWYALGHAARCGPCGAYLKVLQAMIVRLRRGKEAPPEDVLARLAEKVSELKI